MREEVQHWALKPNEQPYVEEHPFQWTRGYHVGGKSLLNAWNQVHSCKNVFVTDGACMASTGTQNPSLTYMALTARAANYAIDELKKRHL